MTERRSKWNADTILVSEHSISSVLNDAYVSELAEQLYQYFISQQLTKPDETPKEVA